MWYHELLGLSLKCLEFCFLKLDGHPVMCFAKLLLWTCNVLLFYLTNFRPMFHSYTSENVKKPLVLWRFQRVLRCDILLKWVKQTYDCFDFYRNSFFFSKKRFKILIPQIRQGVDVGMTGRCKCGIFICGKILSLLSETHFPAIWRVNVIYLIYIYITISEIKKLEFKRDLIEIPSEDSVMNYYKIRQQLKKLSDELLHFIHQPKYLLPFLQPGRLVHVRLSRSYVLSHFHKIDFIFSRRKKCFNFLLIETRSSEKKQHWMPF